MKQGPWSNFEIGGDTFTYLLFLTLKIMGGGREGEVRAPAPRPLLRGPCENDLLAIFMYAIYQKYDKYKKGRILSKELRRSLMSF